MVLGPGVIVNFQGTLLTGRHQELGGNQHPALPRGDVILHEIRATFG